ncbi:MAG: aspartate kinase, partial [Saprospiraceae bacterium]
LKINLMQNTAMKFLVCVDNEPERLKPFLEEVSGRYDVVSTDNLELVTVRHYDSATLEFLKYNRNVLLEERIPQTVQLVMA